MDKTTMTKSSQSFYAFMAMTMTALSVNANASELNSDLLPMHVLSLTLVLLVMNLYCKIKSIFSLKKRILGRDIRDCLNLSGLKKHTMVKL